MACDARRLARGPAYDAAHDAVDDRDGGQDERDRFSVLRIIVRLLRLLAVSEVAIGVVCVLLFVSGPMGLLFGLLPLVSAAIQAVLRSGAAKVIALSLMTRSTRAKPTSLWHP